jgi:hypothetical protein
VGAVAIVAIIVGSLRIRTEPGAVHESLGPHNGQITVRVDAD